MENNFIFRSNIERIVYNLTKITQILIFNVYIEIKNKNKI